jgi:prepilin-type N-terminal cleavage/methylation domain-containing protein
MKKSARGGFTLVEVLIGLMLTALLLQALFPMLVTSFLSWQTSVSRMVTHQTARTAMEAMIRELRFASSIAVPLPGQRSSGIRFTKIDSAGNPQTLIFQQGSSSGMNTRTLYRINPPGEATPLTQEVVSDLYFQFQPPRLVFVSLTLADPQTKVSDTVQTSITCVNMPD